MAVLKPRLLAVLAVCASCLAAPEPGSGQATAPEPDVKAAFLYNFAKFVEWPAASFPEARSPLKLCVLGDDPFGKTLKALIEEGVGGHPVSLLHLDDLSHLAACHVLFVSRSEKERLPQVFESLRDAPVLTVGDTPGFVDQGGMINFLLEGSKVRFEVNQEAAERAGLRISSKLLALAKRVKGRA